MKEDVFLSLGSNQGDRKYNLDRATELLSESLGTLPTAVSDYIETESWGFEAPAFLNSVVAFSLDDPDGFSILATCKEIERTMGREENIEYDEAGRRIYHSRPIDIDIIEIGDRTIESETLTVPHPLACERDFVMIPLAQVKQKMENFK